MYYLLFSLRLSAIALLVFSMIQCAIPELHGSITFEKFELPAVSFSNGKITDVVEKVDLIAKKHGASEKGYKGIVCAIKTDSEVSISLNLEGASIESAFRAIAELGNLEVYFRNGYVILIDTGEPTRHAIGLTPELKRNLGLPLNPTEAQLREVIVTLKINLHPNSYFKIDKSTDFAVLDIQETEFRKLKVIFELIGRGLKIDQQKSEGGQ